MSDTKIDPVFSYVAAAKAYKNTSEAIDSISRDIGHMPLDRVDVGGLKNSSLKEQSPKEDFFNSSKENSHSQQTAVLTGDDFFAGRYGAADNVYNDGFSNNFIVYSGLSGGNRTKKIDHDQQNHSLNNNSANKPQQQSSTSFFKDLIINRLERIKQAEASTSGVEEGGVSMIKLGADISNATIALDEVTQIRNSLTKAWKELVSGT